jgi:hypothetical protein
MKHSLKFDHSTLMSRYQRSIVQIKIGDRRHNNFSRAHILKKCLKTQTNLETVVPPNVPVLFWDCDLKKKELISRVIEIYIVNFEDFFEFIFGLFSHFGISTKTLGA